MRPVIQSTKKYVQNVTFSVATGTTTNIVIVEAVATVGSGAREVIQGSIVKAVFCEYWIMANSNQPSNMLLTIEKVPSDAAGQTFADNQNLFNYKNKKNIFFTTQGLVPDANANPIPFVRQWIKIPKGKQRFGLGDKFVVNFTTITGDNNNVCGLAIFKAYT